MRSAWRRKDIGARQGSSPSGCLLLQAQAARGTMGGHARSRQSEAQSVCVLARTQRLMQTRYACESHCFLACTRAAVNSSAARVVKTCSKPVSAHLKSLLHEPHSATRRPDNAVTALRGAAAPAAAWECGSLQSRLRPLPVWPLQMQCRRLRQRHGRKRRKGCALSEHKSRRRAEAAGRRRGRQS